MTPTVITDSGLARMAGNIAAGLVKDVSKFTSDAVLKEIARISVTLARLIAAELETTPKDGA